MAGERAVGRRVVVLASGLGLAGCAGGEEPPRVTRTDSAGVEIVTDHTLEAPEWRLSHVPRLDLGTVDEEGPEQFFRVADAMVLRDGTLAVVNGGTREIRIFDPEGRHLLSFGRDGEGPGEFGFPAAVHELRADTLVVWDPRLRRISLFGGRGEFHRSYVLPTTILNAELVGILSDGRAVVSGPLFDTRPDEPGFRPAYTRYALVGAEGALLDTLPRQRWGLFGRLGDVWGGPHFDARSVYAGGDRGYWVALGLKEEAVRYSAEGEPVRIVRWPPTDREVSPADVDLLLERELESADPERHARIRERYARQPAAERFPALSRLLVDESGALWVRAYERPGHAGPLHWMVFDTTGALAAYVDIPRALRVFEIGADYVLGVLRDELDVEHVQLLELSREAR